MASLFAHSLLQLLDLKCLACEDQRLLHFQHSICKNCESTLFQGKDHLLEDGIQQIQTPAGLGAWSAHRYEGRLRALFLHAKQNPNSSLAWRWCEEFLSAVFDAYPHWKNSQWLMPEAKPLQWLHINDTFKTCLKKAGVEKIHSAQEAFSLKRFSPLQNKQKELSRKARLNKKGVSLVKTLPPSLRFHPKKQAPLKPKVILFDDVITTGATLFTLYQMHYAQNEHSSDDAKPTRNIMAFTPMWTPLRTKR